jgi:hypothetical protein
MPTQCFKPVEIDVLEVAVPTTDATTFRHTHAAAVGVRIVRRRGYEFDWRLFSAGE